MKTYIRDLFELPERVGKGDFVLALNHGVEHADETLRSYVVTEQLASAFDDALGFIGGALDQRKSRASYLHGSFGSGKSHFMAVLHLLLQGNVQARSIPELASVVTKHERWLGGKRFLLVPYHMIGAHSMESAILGHYAEHIEKLHPEAPMPPVFLAEALFSDAQGLRTRMGNESFFDALNQGTKAADGWGSLAARWDDDTFADALAAPASDERRLQLVSALIATLFPSYAQVARSGGESFVSLDRGLAIISKHAKDLGYDAVILFLDELILWLASRAADVSFVSQEGQKLAKLVEAESADRPIPLVSFVARQRDLRDLVGEHVAGADQLRFADVLSHWEGRFHRITLEDRNLPKIAEKRVLRPKSEDARRKLDDAFATTGKTRNEILQVLLTDEANLATFRQVYPFSPALIETLVAVSSVLQRERTALKVMLQLLVDQKDTLELGQVVPVGDLFDVIADGDEPFTEGMRVNFENAKKLWRTKLLPLLEREHNLREEQVDALPADDPHGRAFRANARLLKTLLLAALAPAVRSLKALNPVRLAALNHGSIRTPIPGQESQEVLARLRRWAGQVGEIKISDDPQNPVIALQITGVDTESIIENNRRADNEGNRRRKVRDLLFRQLGIEDRGELQIAHEKLWRGTVRRYDIVFGNVRELPDDSLRTKGEDRKVVLDFPFDPESRTIADDLARLEAFRESAGKALTLVWLPSFLSMEAQKDLGTLVILDDLLAGERFEQCASHLSMVDRAQARSLLENQRSQLQQRVLTYLEGAYGVAPPPPGSLDRAHDLAEHFQSLDPSFAPRPPVGASLRQAFEHLLDQMLDVQYPAHPRFELEVKPSSLAKILEEVERAVESEEPRIPIDRNYRDVMRGIAMPLELGDMGETHFVLGRRWVERFDREAASDGGGAITVGRLREWMDRPTRRGLPRTVQNLVILAYAAQTDRSLFLHGGAVPAELQRLDDEIELRTQKLPPADAYAKAVQRAGTILGITASKLLNASNATGLAEKLVAEARQHRASCTTLVERLGAPLERFVDAPEQASRIVTARTCVALLDALATAGTAGAIEALASAAVATSEAAMASSLKRAADVASVLESSSWTVFDALKNVTGERATSAAHVLRDLGEALASDEYAVALGSALRRLNDEALRAIVPPSAASPPTPSAATLGASIVAAGQEKGLAPAAVRELIGRLEHEHNAADVELDVAWRVRKRKGS